MRIIRTTMIVAGLAGATLLSASAAVPAAAAPQGGGAGRSCFWSRNISSWTEAGDRTVNFRVGVNDFYQLQLVNDCPDLRFAEAIGLETRGGSNFICSGLDVNVIVPRSVTHTIPQRCMGSSIRKLSPEEVAALPPKQKP